MKKKSKIRVLEDNIEQNLSTTQSSPGGGADTSIKENTIDQQITPRENQEG